DPNPDHSRESGNPGFLTALRPNEKAWIPVARGGADLEAVVSARRRRTRAALRHDCARSARHAFLNASGGMLTSVRRGDAREGRALAARSRPPYLRVSALTEARRSL